jgi:regulator of protease activity HflC (stomatin/prohibitin superfamily)
VVAADFAARTLEALLGENRAAMAERLRAAVQAQLDRAGSGIDLLAVVIEAIHPPAGVADAYHAVPAAETMARAELASAHGNAIALRSQARQSAAAQLAAIGKTPKTIIDHRLNWPEAPVLDLRPITGALPIGDKGE